MAQCDVHLRMLEGGIMGDKLIPASIASILDEIKKEHPHLGPAV